MRCRIKNDGKCLLQQGKLNPHMKEVEGRDNKIAVPEGVDAELLMKVLGNPEMAALLTSLAKTMKR